MTALTRLPGIGPKTAERLAFHLLRVPKDEALALAQAIEAVRRAIKTCGVCFQVDEIDPCRICSDESRDRAMVLVVEESSDVGHFEEAGYQGLYHVLQGRVAGLQGAVPSDLKLNALLTRLRGSAVAEVCLATNPDLEGEATAGLVVERLQAESSAIRVTRIARGLPAGSSIAQVSQSILADAVEGRRSFDGT